MSGIDEMVCCHTTTSEEYLDKRHISRIRTNARLVSLFSTLSYASTQRSRLWRGGEAWWDAERGNERWRRMINI